MRIMSCFGSPRADGNTAKVLAWVEAQWRSDGHTVERVSLAEHALSGCRECFACKSGKIRLCAVKDDANALYERLLAADLVLLATPLFCWNFTAQMKPFIDRMFCLTSGPDDGGDYTSAVEGKPFALLMTSAGPVAGNGEILVRTYESMIGYLKAMDAGQFLVPGCTQPSAIGEDVRRQATAFAARLGAIR
ncbi:MAG: NAD(P)H-dependent oxidoreductase [Candidatus Eisenbacteria bacterium]